MVQSGTLNNKGFDVVLASDSEFADYSEKHLSYEIWMLEKTSAIVQQLDETKAAVAGENTEENDRLKMNMSIESALIHARNLMDFLYAPIPTIPSHDDVRALHYAPSWKPPSEPPNIRYYHLEKPSRINKFLAHLTETRMTKGQSANGWPVPELSREIISVFDCFLRIVDEKKLGNKLRKRKHGLTKQESSSIVNSQMVPSNLKTEAATRTSAPEQGTFIDLRPKQ